jgi:hypothetical protein
MADRPAMHAAIATTRDREIVVATLAEAGVTLPDDLRLALSRLTSSDHLCAAGFVDARSGSVTVDIALWTSPQSLALDARAWHAVFDWLVAADADVCRPRVNGRITASSASVCADYVYEYTRDGQIGHGVLSITSVGSQTWQIVDCWGDASEFARIRELSGTCRVSKTAR